MYWGLYTLERNWGQINMKNIKIFHWTNGHDYRIQHLVKTLSKTNNVCYIDSIYDINNNDDILFLESRHKLNDVIVNKILSFKGKTILYTVDDGCYITVEDFDRILHKIDGWLSLLKNSKVGTLLSDKLILIPRYTIPYINIDDVKLETKINKIVFIGRTTGTYKLNGKNWRIESLNKIYESEFLRNNFDGWIINDKIIDVEYQKDEYNKTFKFVRTDENISEINWIEKLKTHTLSLCVPGHTALGYRHPQSMACMATMVGNFDLSNDIYPFMFSDKLKNISYTVKNDLSDFTEVLEESLNNREKTKEYALKAFEVYKDYYEVNPDNTYKSHIWKLIVENFNQLNIDV